MEYVNNDEFYDEVDQFVCEVTDGIKKNIKKEFLEQMARLEKENAELQAVKRDIERVKYAMEQDARKAQRDLEIEKEAAKRAPLAAIMKLASTPIYTVDHHYERQPKCPNCDRNREVPYVSADGRTKMGSCACAEQKDWYIPKEKMAVTFLSSSRDHQEITFMEDSDRDKTTIVFKKAEEVFCDGVEDFSSMNKYSAIFRSVKDAQAYCDWLNAKEGKKS